MKRTKFMTFVNTSTNASPTWVLEGKGVDDLSVDMSPKTESYTDVTADTATTDLVGYEPKIPVSKRVQEGDTIFEMIHGMYKNRAVGTDAIKEICNVYAWEAATAGAYPAERQSVTISIKSVGGKGGDQVIYEYEMAYRGDAVKGTFNPTTKTFTAA